MSEVEKLAGILVIGIATGVIMYHIAKDDKSDREEEEKLLKLEREKDKKNREKEEEIEQLEEEREKLEEELRLLGLKEKIKKLKEEIIIIKQGEEKYDGDN